jgi:hypothetical protein
MRFAYNIERWVSESPDCGTIVFNEEKRTLRHDLKQDQTRILHMGKPIRCLRCTLAWKKPALPGPSHPDP